eukprot:scaffold32232_cov55-Phaeocystis_antarctica.AAC.3
MPPRPCTPPPIVGYVTMPRCAPAHRSSGARGGGSEAGRRRVGGGSEAGSRRAGGTTGDYG